MKLIYDEQGRLSEILGSGENGDLTTNEVSAFKHTWIMKKNPKKNKWITVKK